jgi:hypothetical protein
MVQIKDFESLLEATLQQPESFQLLFVFAKSALPPEHSEEESERFKSGLGGELTPMMCVDKSPDELSNFKALALEAEKLFLDWQMVFIGALPGAIGAPPGKEAIDEALKNMVQAIQFGGDMSGYLIFDKNGDPIRIV